ncbi:MAG: MBOAT family protein [Hyphomicrobiales bacterium]
MVFSSLLFLFVFLPIVLIGNYLLKRRLRNYFLLGASLIFFAWGGVSYSLILIISLIINYFTGRLINKYTGSNKAKVILTIGIIINLACLGLFKYANFIVENINYLLPLFKAKPIKDLGIILPIGISFYTFQAISYIVDVYRKEVKVQKKFSDLALYISFFPQLIAGPIIRYQNIEKQLKYRKSNWTNIETGIRRFTLGLFKKVIIANQFGAIADIAFELDANIMNSTDAWIGIIAYTIQIYFDFSGYSDMAIGLGRMLGFHFPENFNFPYIAKSIKEFWQRWHITLSDWFRNYLYFPLGGNRKGYSRTMLNLLIIFFATSIWHGASWNFVIWGMTHGVFMVIERIGFGKVLEKLWTPIQHLYALLIIIYTRVFFVTTDFSHGLNYLKKLNQFDFGIASPDLAFKINSPLIIILFIVAVLSSTRLPLITLKFIQKGISNTRQYKALNIGLRSGLYIGELAFVMITIITSTIMLIADSYNPFIYFRF